MVESIKTRKQKKQTFTKKTATRNKRNKKIQIFAYPCRQNHHLVPNENE